MITFAITGGIATGKSTVTNIIKRKYNIPIVDADIIAREIVEPGMPCLEHLVHAFSDKILNSNGTLNRSYLGNIVFNNKESLDTINRIMGKVIKEESFNQIQKLHTEGNYLVGYDSALLIESGSYTLYNPIIVVSCSQETQVSRLMRRNNLIALEAAARIASQMSLDEKAKFANFIINNDKGYSELESEVDLVVEKLKQL